MKRTMKKELDDLREVFQNLHKERRRLDEAKSELSRKEKNLKSKCKRAGIPIPK